MKTSLSNASRLIPFPSPASCPTLDRIPSTIPARSSFSHFVGSMPRQKIRNRYLVLLLGLVMSICSQRAKADLVSFSGNLTSDGAVSVVATP
jgi:hypothetical protein